MKKLIRLFIAIFCVFFALRAMPGSFVPVFRSFARNAAEKISDATLLLAEKIDDGLGTLNGQDSPGGGIPDAEQGDRKEPAGNSDVNGGDPAKDNKGSGTGSEGPEGNGDAKGADESSPEEDRDAGGADESSPEEDREPAGSSGDGPEETGGPAGSDGDGPDGGTPSGTEAEDAAGPQDSGRTSRRTQGEADISYYYYTCISKEERLLYDAMLALARDPVAGADASESRLLGLNPSSEEFAESYTRAYNALMSDHPELFWIAQGRVRYECKYYLLPSFGGKYKILLSLADASGNDSFTQYKEEMADLEAAADALLDQVDFSRTDAEISLRLHDLLIDNAWYNISAGTDDYAHTAYGALVEDSLGNPGGALCDGYALAYEYLLQRAGLTCTMVCGYAGASEEDTEKHAWNLVQLDGDWYEVDPTWDDLDFLLSPSDDGYDLLLEALSDEEYMAAIRHYMFNRTTEQMRSFTPGEEYRYVSYNGWVTLLQPSVHIRFTEEESEETRDFVTPLAPVAEGTWYTWGMLMGLE